MASKLLVCSLISFIVVPNMIPYISPFKEFRLYSSYSALMTPFQQGLLLRGGG